MRWYNTLDLLKHITSVLNVIKRTTTTKNQLTPSYPIHNRYTLYYGDKACYNFIRTYGTYEAAEEKLKELKDPKIKIVKVAFEDAK